jgi:hypothetical protein
MVDHVAALSEISGTPFVGGSLNLVSDVPVWLDARAAFYRSEGHIFWRASLEGVPVVLNRWSSCPAHIFEVFAPVQLRSALGLDDGHVVRLEVSDEIVCQSDASFRNKTVWYLFWKYREKLFYHDAYLSLLRSRWVGPYTWRSMQRQ